VPEGPRVVYTLGYGGRTLEELLSLVKSLGVRVVVDVRRWNKSVRLPEFSGESLSSALRSIGVEYVWLPALGGYRRFGVDVEDVGVAKCFESEGFRAYATYIVTRAEAKAALGELVSIAESKVAALLCREKYPWLCHRKIISDYLVAKGFRVLHAVDPGRLVEHRLSKCAVVEGGELKYV